MSDEDFQALFIGLHYLLGIVLFGLAIILHNWMVLIVGLAFWAIALGILRIPKVG